MEFKEEHHDVNGVDAAVLTAGEGEPLVFFHGGGVLEGFDCFGPLAERYRLLVPYHPGFGPSGDDPGVASVHDWVRHYLELFDLLGLRELSLIGHSLGGWLASWFSIDHGHRVRQVVLAAPFGMDVPGHGLANLGAMAPDEILQALTRDPTVFEGKLPIAPDDAFLAARAREGQTVGAIRPGASDPTLGRWLHRLTMPTLVIWGDDDQIVPAAHLPEWEMLIPDAKTVLLPGKGHLLFHEGPEAVAAVGAFLDS